MKEIKLGNDTKVALVDDEDYKILNQYKWHNNIGYARTDIKDKDKWVSKLMHRLLIDVPDKMEIDHIDGNPLNNQKSNLRLVTHQQNQMNSQKRKKTSSKYKGVTFDKWTGRWESYIGYNNKKIHLGRFKSEIDAAKAYNEKAKELYGEFANLNIIEE